MLPPAPRPAAPSQLRRTLQPTVEAAAARPGVDRYRKIFPALAHLWILMFHVLDGSPSLRQTHARLRFREALWRAWGMRRFVSRSQLTRSTTSRPLEGALHLCTQLFAQAAAHPVHDLHLRTLLYVEAVDSTFLRLSEHLAPWSRHGRAEAGVYLQCGLALAQELPTWLVLHRADATDRSALASRDLTPLAGWTLLIDKGYYAHTLFANLLRANVDFITRRYASASYTIRERWKVSRTPLASGEMLQADLLIDLGSPNNRASTVVRGVRLIQYETAAGDVHEVLTSRLDLPASDVIALYRKRWRIELFFRFLKRQLGMMRPLGYSRKALWLTVLLAAIVAVLLLLVDGLRPADTTRVAWARAIATVLTDQLTHLKL